MGLRRLLTVACVIGAMIGLATAPSLAGTIHKVKKGDTLWEIAKHYGVSLAALKQANPKAEPRALRVGQTIVVPASKGKSPAKSSGKQAKPSLSQALANTALGYKGVRYRYGGMSSRGFDCSGLVARVLRTHGIRAPHNSAALYKLGKPVAKSQLRAGDLVFFNTSGRGISHVGIYIGEGKFVHAATSRGRVCTDSLRTGYYAHRYVGARRLT